MSLLSGQLALANDTVAVPTNGDPVAVIMLSGVYTAAVVQIQGYNGSWVDAAWTQAGNAGSGAAAAQNGGGLGGSVVYRVDAGLYSQVRAKLVSIGSGAVTATVFTLPEPGAQFPTAVTVPGGASVGGYTAVPAASKTRPANTTAYAAGQVVAESTTAATVWTFANCVRANGGTGAILGALLTDTSKQGTTPQFNLWLFSALPTIQNDAVAFAPSAGDLANLVAVVNLSNWTAANANGILQTTEINRPFKCAAGGTSLFGVLVAANAYVPVSGETLSITLQIGED